MRPLALALALLLGGCSAPVTDLDAATSDVGRVTEDAGRDASASDAALDTGAPASDAAATDAGSAEDTGTPDAFAAADTGPRADAGAPAPEGCFTDVGAGHHLFPCDGIDYDVEISAACAMGGCGLVFDVHGATMDAASEEQNTRLRVLGPAAGYVVVQPTAPASGIGPSWDPTRDDPKVFAFLQLTMRALRIDPDRVHFTGFSQGGFMSWRMLCDHADVFASIAPAAACGALFPGCAFSAGDRPARELPVLYMHGTTDRIVSGCWMQQRDAVVNGWSMTLDTTVSMDASHRWTRYLSTAGTPFEMISHDYAAYSYVLGGHCMPGSPDIGTNRFGTTGFGCEDTSPITWGQTVLAFFVAHPR